MVQRAKVYNGTLREYHMSSSFFLDLGWILTLIEPVQDIPPRNEYAEFHQFCHVVLELLCPNGCTYIQRDAAKNSTLLPFIHGPNNLLCFIGIFLLISRGHPTREREYWRERKLGRCLLTRWYIVTQILVFLDESSDNTFANFRVLMVFLWSIETFLSLYVIVAYS